MDRGWGCRSQVVLLCQPLVGWHHPNCAGQHELDNRMQLRDNAHTLSSSFHQNIWILKLILESCSTVQRFNGVQLASSPSKSPCACIGVVHGMTSSIENVRLRSRYCLCIITKNTRIPVPLYRTYWIRDDWRLTGYKRTLHTYENNSIGHQASFTTVALTCCTMQCNVKLIERG